MSPLMRPTGIFPLVMSPLMRPTGISSQLSRPNLLSWSPASKPTPDPVLKIKNIHCSRSLPARLVWGIVNFDHAASFLHVWSGVSAHINQNLGFNHGKQRNKHNGIMLYSKDVAFKFYTAEWGVGCGLDTQMKFSLVS